MSTLLKGIFAPALSVLSGWQGYVAALVLGLALGAGGTWRVMSWHEQAQQTQVITKTVKQIVYQDRVTEKVVTQYVKVKGDDIIHTETLLQEVPTYVTKEADARCVVSLGFVRVWNSAVHGPVPDATAGADDAPSGLACSDVAKAAVQIAGTYDATSHQLTALQDWVTQQRALSEKNQ